MPSVPPHAEQPGLWTLGHVLALALMYHLKALPSLGNAKGEVKRGAVAFAIDVLDFVRAKDLTYRVTIPLAGVHLAPSRKKPLRAGGAALRALSGDEQGSYMDAWGIGRQNVFLNIPTVALVIDVPTARMGQHPDPSATISNWLCALYLQGYTLVGREARMESHPSWISVGTSNIPLRMLEHITESKMLSPRDFEKVHATVEKLKKYNIGAPLSSKDYAVHRFYLGAARPSAADALVDFVVALESLLLPYDSEARHGDLGYRFRLHGGHYLTEKKAERMQVFKQLKTLYELRSALVHGGKFPKPSDIEEGRRMAMRLARIGVLRALETGFPRPEDFRVFLLGA